MRRSHALQTHFAQAHSTRKLTRVQRSAIRLYFFFIFLPMLQLMSLHNINMKDQHDHHDDQSLSPEARRLHARIARANSRGRGATLAGPAFPSGSC